MVHYFFTMTMNSKPRWNQFSRWVSKAASINSYTYMIQWKSCCMHACIYSLNSDIPSSCSVCTCWSLIFRTSVCTCWSLIFRTSVCTCWSWIFRTSACTCWCFTSNCSLLESATCSENINISPYRFRIHHNLLPPLSKRNGNFWSQIQKLPVYFWCTSNLWQFVTSIHYNCQLCVPAF